MTLPLPKKRPITVHSTTTLILKARSLLALGLWLAATSARAQSLPVSTEADPWKKSGSASANQTASPAGASSAEALYFPREANPILPDKQEAKADPIVPIKD